MVDGVDQQLVFVGVNAVFCDCDQCFDIIHWVSMGNHRIVTAVLSFGSDLLGEPPDKWIEKQQDFQNRLQQVHPSRRLGDQRQRLQLAEISIQREMKRRLKTDEQTVSHLQKRLSALHPGRTISNARDRLAGAADLLNREIKSLLRQNADRAAQLSRTLNAVSPLQTVGRGYALLTGSSEGQVVSSVSAVPEDRKITAQVADGRLICTVEETDDRKPDSLVDTRKPD